MSGRLVNVRPKPGFAMLADGAISALPMRDGALANILTGRGTSVDRGQHNLWLPTVMTPQQVEAAYCGSWLHRKIVDVPAEDQTRAGRDWEADDKQIKKIEAEEKRLALWSKVRTALTYGRLGGGALFINLGDDPAAPLPKTVRPEQIVSLVPLHRTHISIGAAIDHILDPFYGQPENFRVNTPRQPEIHRSRLLLFKGQMVPGMHDGRWEDRFWGDSVIQVVNEAVQNATTGTAGFASLIDEAKVDVFTFKALVETLAQPNGEKKFMERLQVMATGKSIHRMVALGDGDTWETRELSFTGAKDLITTFMAIVAGAADIPATRLLGKSPEGMNSTGESDLANYFQGQASQQETDLRPALEVLDPILLSSAGVDLDLTWTFSPLQVLSEKEQAEIESREAQTLKTLDDTGMFSSVALEASFSNRMIESGRWPGYKDKRDEQIKSGDFDPSDDESDPSALVATQPGGGDPASAGGGIGEQPPARRAANDAAPRTLYVRRDVVNVAEIKAWAKSQGLPDLQDGLHVTIVHIEQPFDWMKVDGEWNQDDKGEMTIAPGGVRIVEPLGNRTAVLLFTSSQLSWRHESILRAAEAQDRFPMYQPHVSLTGDDVDLTNVEPYRGKIVLGPEIFEPVDDGI